MNIWFVTTVLPQLETSGGEIASQAFIDALRASGNRVTVFGFAREGDVSPVPTGSLAVERRPIETAASGLKAYGWMAGALASGRPYVCEKFHSPRFAKIFAQTSQQARPDLIVIDHAQMGWLLPVLKRYGVPLVFIAHNVESELYAAQAAKVSAHGSLKRFLLKRDAALIGRIEQELARTCAQVWTLTEAERKVFDGFAGTQKARTMELPGRRIEASREPIATVTDVGMLGTWAWEVNGRGLRWFIDEVMPHIPASITVRVGGRGSEVANGCFPNLTGVGFVDDPVIFMREARVLAVPTITGAGIQLKTIEAIATGVPVVSTTLGVRGLAHLPAYVHVADEPSAFAETLASVVASRPQADVAAATSWVEMRRQIFADGVRGALEACVSQRQ